MNFNTNRKFFTPNFYLKCFPNIKLNKIVEVLRDSSYA